MLGSQVQQSLHQGCVGEVAAVLVGLEEHQLHVVDQGCQELHVGQDVVGHHVRGGAHAERAAPFQDRK